MGIGIRLSALALIPFLCVGLSAKTDQEALSRLIDDGIRRHIDDVIKIRRFLHMNPELGNREYETAKLIASKLLSLGLEVRTSVARTGVVGLMQGSGSGITLGMRADMDALPIQEENRLPYRSLNPGVMHACGHDVHTAVVLGAAMVLSEIRNRINGNIKFIFQPAEEGPPAGEEGGAALMIREGVLQNPPVRAIIGFHVWPEAEVGHALVSSGPIMAASDGFTITITGKSAHGARPHEGVDAVVLAARTVVAVQSVLSRGIDPTRPAVVTIGKINGGVRANILASRVTLEGTVRTLDPEVRDRIETLLETISTGIAEPFGAGCEYEYRRGTAPVYNHPDLVSVLRPVVESVLGADRVMDLAPQMVAEDFSAFSESVPGFYFMLGVRPPGHRRMPPLHSPHFNPDERSIAVGIRVLCHLTLKGLESPGPLERNGFLPGGR